MKVEYDDHMGSDLSVVNAARVSFDKRSTVLTGADRSLIKFLARGMQNRDWEKFLEGIMNEVAIYEDKDDLAELLLHWKRQPQHWAPFAHPHISIRITTSIFVARQLVKHQIGFAWSEVSRRYVDDAPTFEPVDRWRKRAANVKQGSSDEFTKYPPIVLNGQAFEFDEVQRGLALAYVDAVDANGPYQVAPEQARMTLPLTLQTSWIWTGSLAAWARMLTQRCDPHAQLETRQVAEAVLPIVRELFPVSIEALVGR